MAEGTGPQVAVQHSSFVHSCQCSFGRRRQRLQLLPAAEAAPLQFGGEKALQAAHHAAVVWDGDSRSAPCLHELQQDLHLAAYSALQCLLGLRTIGRHRCMSKKLPKLHRP